MSHLRMGDLDGIVSQIAASPVHILIHPLFIFLIVVPMGESPLGFRWKYADQTVYSGGCKHKHNDRAGSNRTDFDCPL